MDRRGGHRAAVDRLGDVGRINAFSDGIFAIAATLLSLEIRFPELDGTSEVNDFSGQLVDALPSILAFAFAFMAIAVYWVTHHRVFLLIERADGRLLWLNSVFLMFVAFLPVPSALVMRHPTEPVLVAFYLCSLIPVSLSHFVLWRHVCGPASLVSLDVSPLFARYLSVRAMAPVIAATASLVAFIVYAPLVYSFGFAVMSTYIVIARRLPSDDVPG